MAATSSLLALLSKLSASQFGCDLQLLPAFCFLLLFPYVVLRAPSFCSLTRQFHLAPSSAYSVSWFPCVSLIVCQVGTYMYWTAVLLFAIIREYYMALLYEISCRITKLSLLWC